MSISKKFWTLATVVALALPLRAEPREILGVKVPDTKTVAGKELKVNGSGIRTATMLRVKLYVASFYTPTPVSTEKEALALEGPLRFDFAFLRPFPKEKVVEAWQWTFEQSNTHVYPNMKKDFDEFSNLFGAIAKFGVEGVEIDGDETRVYDDQVLRGSIKGKDFQKAFMSLWFGPKPVMPELKKAFLGKK